MIDYAEITIIVPCRNESENIKTLNELMSLIPESLEIILVEGGSSDDTPMQCKIMEGKHPSRVKHFEQSKKGKMNAVAEGIMLSSRSHVAIFDADLTVSLQDQLKLIEFYRTGDGKFFVTGNRLNKQMHRGAMQYSNIIANYLFGVLFSGLMHKRIVDTLCGTKIFPREIFLEPICNNLQVNDPFGDFAMITNAWLYNLEICSLKVEYLPRRYGVTNIKRWSSGIILVKNFSHAALRHLSKNQKKKCN
jgi:glycosyltransferase involved in cell wall biosynthesis